MYRENVKIRSILLEHKVRERFFFASTELARIRRLLWRVSTARALYIGAIKAERCYMRQCRCCMRWQLTAVSINVAPHMSIAIWWVVEYSRPVWSQRSPCSLLDRLTHPSWQLYYPRSIYGIDITVHQSVAVSPTVCLSVSVSLLNADVCIIQESPANAKGTRDSSACMKTHCEQM